MSSFVMTQIDPNNWNLRPQILEFIRENSDVNTTRNRSDADLLDALNTGEVIVVYDDLEICACSLVYEKHNEEFDRLLTEIGTQIVTSNGYNLQAFISMYHLFHFYTMRPEEFPLLYGIVKKDSRSNDNLISNVAMQKLAIPPELQESCPQHPQKCLLYADRSAYQHAFKQLRKLHLGGNRFKTLSGDGVIEIVIPSFTPVSLDALGED